MLDPIIDSLLLRFFLALGIGALIGLEREHAESGGIFAGSRTFPLFAVIGAITQAFFPTLLSVALIALTVPLTVAYAAKAVTKGDIGLTTVTASVLTVFLGALTVHSQQGATVAVLIGGVVTVLLSSKTVIHRLVDQVDESERRASLKFILVVFVVLPLLPDRELEVLYGLNPRFIWLMVVFVTGLSFGAYILTRSIGAKRGIALTGILGGFVSSTATTVSMAERTSEAPGIYQISSFSIVVASIVMFPRALVEVAVVNPSLLSAVVVPLGAMTVAGSFIAGVAYWDSTTVTDIETDLKNPFRLQPALFFGAVFAVVLLGSELANTWFGESGIYATAFFFRSRGCRRDHTHIEPARSRGDDLSGGRDNRYRDRCDRKHAYQSRARVANWYPATRSTGNRGPRYRFGHRYHCCSAVNYPALLGLVASLRTGFPVSRMRFAGIELVPTESAVSAGIESE
jgi:uncharacterized membrane protein (DUF4010 family)